jgi:hypothetical protein
MEETEPKLSLPGLSRQSRQERHCAPDRDARVKPAHDDGEGEWVIAANLYVLQELAKEPGTREHEIISYRRRYLVKPHGYPLSGRDGAGRRVLFHSDEKEKFGAG